MKKFLTFILVLAMVLSVSSVALAVSGAGTESDPYIVTDETSFNEALAGTGEFIRLDGSFSVSNKIVIGRSVTINGNGYTLTYTGSDRAIDIPTSSESKVNVTIKDLTVIGNAQRGINYNDDGELTLENVQVGDFGTLFTYALNLPGKANGCKVTINGGRYTGCIAINVWGNNSAINVKNATLTSVDDSNVEGYAVVKLNNNGGTSAEGTVINVEGGSIYVVGSSPEDTYVGLDPTVTGEIKISSTDINMSEGKPNTKEQYVAIINYPPSDNFYSYKTLEDAVAAAKPGETITLLTDDVDVSSIQTDKNLTIKTKDGKEYVTKNGEVGVDAGNGIFVTPPELKFDTVKVGYTQPAGKVIKVTGIPSGFSVTFTVSGNYEISADGTNYSKNSVQGNVANGSAQVYVRPILDLGDGAYAGNVDVSFDTPSGPSAAPESPEVALSFKVDPAPSSGSGISVKYNGGNSFSTSNPSVPTGVEIDGVPVTFNGTGSNFSVGCISSDAKWVTVRWNSTSVTTNFTPDGLVECTTVSIPKTGGMSFWAAIAQFLGF